MKTANCFGNSVSKSAERSAVATKNMRIIAVTACPTGIAHTYMAAEKLEKTAKRLGHSIKVETQGALGVENQLSQEEVDAAEVAILATDIAIEQVERFDKIR